MEDSLKKFLIKEIADDLYENPDDAWHILNGLKCGHPDDADEIAIAAMHMIQDRELLDDPEFKESIEQMRRGEGIVRL